MRSSLFGSSRPLSAFARSAGPSLDAQPAPFTVSVNLFFLFISVMVGIIFLSLEGFKNIKSIITYLFSCHSLSSAYPERGYFWMELSAVNDQRSAKSLILLL